MGNLILNSLEIRGFRGFRHLQIVRLGRVNLIVGKNNVGKSSLLKAIRLYARRGSLALIWELLRERDESVLPSSSRPTSLDFEKRLAGLKYLFYERQDIRDFSKSLQIGPINSPVETLSITTHLPAGNDIDDDQIPRLSANVGGLSNVNYPLNASTETLYLLEARGGIQCIFIPATGLDEGQIGKIWDGIALTDLEEDVLAALRIIAPGVEKVNIVGNPVQERTPIVKIKSIDEPIPLHSLGHGLQRTFSIILALVNARNGLLLIDEFENGLYYAVQPDVWRIIFQVARRLNIQVFATTHSWDCIEGFQKATQQDNQEEGMLIRLDGKKGEIVATLFDERLLEIATREQVEVR